MTPAEISTFFERLSQANPTPETELQFTNHYTLLVAVILSAQATDKGVNKATRTLFEKVSTPQDMLDLGEEALLEFVKTIGLYRSKARYIMATSRLLVEHYGGQVPNTREALETLPGCGRKTANVVLNVAFGHPTFAVDTHIFRVCNRTGLAPGKTPRDVERGLEEHVPETYRLHAHHWLILHGRYTCIARTPKCPQCPVRDLCEYPNKTSL